MLLRTWQIVRRFLDFIDTAIAAALAVVFIALGLAGTVKGDALTQATLGLLCVLALSLLRDRKAREDFVTRMEGELAEIHGELPFRSRYVGLTWDLNGEHGRMATVTDEREVQFVRNGVDSICIHSKADGEEDIVSITGRDKGEPNYHDLRCIEKAFLHGGKWFTLVSLGARRNLGDRFELKWQRTLIDSFADDSEYVVYEAISPSTG